MSVTKHARIINSQNLVSSLFSVHLNCKFVGCSLISRWRRKSYRQWLMLALKKKYCIFLFNFMIIFCISFESCSTSYFTESVHKRENKKGFKSKSLLSSMKILSTFIKASAIKVLLSYRWCCNKVVKEKGEGERRRRAEYAIPRRYYNTKKRVLNAVIWNALCSHPTSTPQPSTLFLGFSPNPSIRERTLVTMHTTFPSWLFKFIFHKPWLPVVHDPHTTFLK